MKKNALIGPGGAPTRATTIPEEPSERKKHPVASGVLDYFPDALVAISRVSWAGNEQHNPGKPLHWARGKSGDHADALMRHFLQRGTVDTDGIRHTAKLAWRALAMLQEELEQEAEETPAPEPGDNVLQFRKPAALGRWRCSNCLASNDPTVSECWYCKKPAGESANASIPTWNGVPLTRWRCKPCGQVNPGGRSACGLCESMYDPEHAEAA